MKGKVREREEMCGEYYRVLIAALRHIAYRCGYALCVHGTLRRDIDLVAVAWRDSAIDAHLLAEKIRQAAKAIIGFAHPRKYDTQPEEKPCGRLAWSFYLTDTDEPPYIDLSVVPVERLPRPRKGEGR